MYISAFTSMSLHCAILVNNVFQSECIIVFQGFSVSGHQVFELVLSYLANTQPKIIQTGAFWRRSQIH